MRQNGTRWRRRRLAAVPALAIAWVAAWGSPAWAIYLDSARNLSLRVRAYTQAAKDYRANGLLKPSAIKREKEGGAPAGFVFAGCDGQLGKCDFVNASSFEWFIQSHIESDFMHGQLKPVVTAIFTGYGAMAWMPEVTYRVTDSFLLNTKYVNIHTFGSINNGFGPSIGGARDRDQIWLRATYQLN